MTDYLVIGLVLLLAFHVLGSVLNLRKKSPPMRKTPLNEMKETIPRKNSSDKDQQ